TVVQGAWAATLSRYSGKDDVIYGVVVSGRPAELNGVEEMVGPFINTLPTRVRMDAEENVLAWLKRLQHEQAEARQYEYSPLVQVQQWSDMPHGTPLFETISLFENFPVNAASAQLN